MNFLRRVQLSRWGQPLKSIVVDYVEVSKEVFTDFKSSPGKGITLLAIIGTGIAFLRRCPDHDSYKQEVIDYSNELGLCAEANRNPKTKQYIEEISSILSNHSAEYWNLGVCAFIVQSTCSRKCQNYHEVCKYLQPRSWTVYHRILDFGIWNQWFVLSRTMIDFDINEEEFSKQ